MRIWNLPVTELDNQHLLGEHLELHVMWTTLTENRRGWANHPETRRFRGRLGALYRRHEEQVAEMKARGMTGHKSPLDRGRIPPEDSWEWPPVSEEQLEKDRHDLVAHFPGWRRAANDSA
ncbi:MAG: pyrimidine dimer DNA glycosylase/endonuclease V [Chloroflexota bacterium]